MASVSCTIEVPNVKTHVQLPGGGAYFKYLNSETEGRLDQLQWELERIGTLCFYPNDFGEILKFIEKSCAKHNDCVLNKEELNSIKRILIFAKAHRNDKQPN